MKIDIIFYSKYNCFLEEEVANKIFLKMGDRYYEHYNDYLIEYKFIKELKQVQNVAVSEEIVILIINNLSYREEKLLNQLSSYSNLFIIQPNGESSYKAAINILQLQKEKWHFEVFRNLVKELLSIGCNELKTSLRRLQAKYLLFGEATILGELIINLLQNLCYIEHYNNLSLNIYSKIPLAIDEISQVEDVLREYIDVACHFIETSKQDTQLAYVLSGE